MGRTVGGRLAAGERPLTARYALDEVLARGGVGEVWRARDLRLNRPVAVKVLHGAQADPHFRTRFRNEAQHAARLSHPNIAAVFDYGEEAAEDGDEPTPFLVMELVEGESLADLLARRGRLGVGRTLSILRQLSAGLAAAHEAGVVHRDVKPANVLVRPDGLVKITDFGIAASAASAALTETGQVMGTARYLSPEQARGRRGTPASDVYALGLVGYECLAGRPAFDGPDPVQVAAKQVTEPPPPLPPDVPEQVCGLVRTATAKDPARRLPDGAALRDALDRLLENGRRAARSAVPPRYDPAAGAAALGTRSLDETTVETTGPVPVPVPVPGRSGGATAAENGNRRSRRRWWPVAVGGVLLCALATVLLVVGRSGAAGSPGTVRAGLDGGTAGTTSTSDRAPLPGAAGVPGPATVAAPGAPAGAADAGGPTAAAPTAGGPTAGSVRGTARGHGARDSGTTATGAGAGTPASTGAPTAGTGRTGTAGAATGSAGPTAGGPSASGESSTTVPAGAATDNGSPSAGSTGSGSGAGSSAGSTGTSTGGSGSTSGSTAGPTDGGSTGTGGTEPAGGGTSSAGTGASGTDTSGTGTGTSGAGTSGTGASSTGSTGTSTPGP